jgi:hypothetical protein
LSHGLTSIRLSLPGRYLLTSSGKRWEVPPGVFPLDNGTRGGYTEGKERDMDEERSGFDPLRLFFKGAVRIGK